MKIPLLPVLVILPLIVATSPAYSGPNANAKILIHLSNFQGVKAQPDHLDPYDAAITSCSNSDSEITCSEVITAGRLYPPKLYPYAYVLVMDADAAAGIAEVRFSVDYDAAAGQGVDIFGWSRCGSLEFTTPGPNGAWPSAQSCNRVIWDPDTNCQRLEPGGPGTGAIAVVGSFYLGAYTPSEMSVIPCPDDGTAIVVSCADEIDIVGGGDLPPTPAHLGRVKFSALGNEEGYNPCGLPTPVELRTWSGVKSLFR